MKKYLAVSIVISLVAVLCLAQTGTQKTRESHVMVAPEALKWGPAPANWVRGTPPAEFAGTPRKSQWAVVQGDPTKAGAPFVIRVKSPDGERVPPHWHPQEEHLTVLQGTFFLGTGEKFDATAAHEMRPGSYALMPKKVMHFGWSKGETIVQVHGVGPFVINLSKPVGPASSE